MILREGLWEKTENPRRSQVIAIASPKVRLAKIAKMEVRAIVAGENATTRKNKRRDYAVL
jgi:hypothetical protein